MYKVGCNCLPLILLFLTFFILLKFWFVFFVLILIPIIFLTNKQLIANLKSVFKKKQSEFKNTPGKVYKVCAYCNTKTERSEMTCKNCGRPFE